MTDIRCARRGFLGLGAGLAASALAPSILAETSRHGAFNWTLHRPEEVGMSRAGLEAVRATVQKHIDSNEQTGVVTAIARRNKLVWYEAQGVRDVKTGAPMRKDDLFRMMSSTKPLTAVCVLMMMEAGRLSLDDKVSRFIPSFKDPKVAVPPAGWERAIADPALRAKVASEVKLVPADREITVKDLLTHTSGLSSFGSTLGPGPGSLVNTIKHVEGEALADYINRLGSSALDFQPGTLWRYSPLDGFETLLRVVEITSGQPADAFMRERLFQPLGMRDTYFNVPEAKQGRLLTLYERKDGAWRTAPPMFGVRPTKYFSGAGGLMSTAHDYMQFEAMLFNHGELNGRRLLRPSTVALMTRNQVGSLFADWIPPVTAGMGFGLGLGITLDPAVAKSGRSRGAFGWGGAYGTESWADPELELTAAFFVQQPVRGALTDFQEAIRKAIVA